MNSISKGRFLKTNNIWFEHFHHCPKNMKGDVFQIHGNDVELGHGENHKQLSLISDLTNGVDDLKIAKTVRQEIGRCTKENVRVVFFMNDEVTPEILLNFQTNYMEMYKSKGMDNVKINLGEILGYIQARAFLLSVAYIGTEPVVFHSYVFDQQHARLLHSCSTFRNEDKVNRNAIGRANKYLHWRDLEFFYMHQVFSYDWGGVSSFDDPNGIDKFKMSFGGTPIEYYNIRILKSFKAKLLYTFKKLFGK